MEGKDNIKDLFSQKLGNYEVPVGPEVWASVSAQIPSVASSTAIGISTLSKILIGSSIAATLAVGSYFIFKESPENKKEVKKQEKTETKENQDIKEIDNNNSSEKNSVTIITQPQLKEIELNTSLNSKINTFESQTLENAIENNTSQTVLEKHSTLNAEEEKNKFGIQENKQPILKQVESYQVSTNAETTQMVHSIDNSKIAQKTSEIILELPNVFTPNGDGKNDYLEFDTKNIQDFSIVVLDEKGKTVFQSIDNSFKWDGRMPNGDMVESGNFVYYLTGKDTDGKLITKYSRLTVKY